ncbi:MAG: helix-turn-helix transcriptional regulator [Candidatus Gastranaerophilales bacterium]
MSNNNFLKIGKQIKALRISKKYTQVKLAMLLCISREHLSEIERGVTFPSVKLLYKIIEQTGGSITID